MANIMENEELLDKLANVDTVEELKQILTDNNITLEDGVTAEQFLETVKGGAELELGEDDLDDVSGGAVPMLFPVLLPIGITLARYLARRRR